MFDDLLFDEDVFNGSGSAGTSVVASLFYGFDE